MGDDRNGDSDNPGVVMRPPLLYLVMLVLGFGFGLFEPRLAQSDLSGPYPDLSRPRIAPRQWLDFSARRPAARDDALRRDRARGTLPRREIRRCLPRLSRPGAPLALNDAPASGLPRKYSRKVRMNGALRKCRISFQSI